MRVTRRSVAASVAVAAGIACLVEPTAAQSVPDAPPVPGFDPVLSFVGKAALNLVVGAIVLGVAPEFSRSVVDRIRSRPVESFAFGIAAYVAVVAATLLLFLTVVGIVVAVPGLVVLAVVGVAANLLAVVAVGTLAVDSSLRKSLVVGAVAVSLLTTIPPLTDPVNFLLGTLGMGAIAARYWERRNA